MIQYYFCTKMIHAQKREFEIVSFCPISEFRAPRTEIETLRLEIIFTACKFEYKVELTESERNNSGG